MKLRLKRDSFMVTLGIAAIVLPVIAYAAAAPTKSAITYFGGMITNVTTCTCYYDPALLITINDLKSKKSLKIKYSWITSLLHANYNLIEDGIAVKGAGYSGDTACLNTSGYYCDTNSNGPADTVVDFVHGIGTGLNPTKSSSPL